MSSKTTPRAGDRRDHPTRNVQPKSHDPYRRRYKTADAIVCDDCGIVFHAGRWYRGAPPLCDERSGLCPACRRIRDGYPAGTLLIHGLPEKYRAEVLAMIHHAEACERREHPLERLIDLTREDGRLVVTTTGLHVARRVARALQRRFHGGIEIQYPEGEHLVRIDWTA